MMQGMSGDKTPEQRRAKARAQPSASMKHALRDMIESALEHAQDPPEFQREIARGGVGSIGVAHDPALKRSVAVKTLHRESYSQPILVRGFLREALVTGQLDHPNIVAVHGIGKSRQLGLYFSMGLVEGKSLDKLIAEQGDLDYEKLIRLLDIIDKVCSALAYAHSRGVVHCDIKPANIMVGEFGQVYVMDWGGARLLESERAVQEIRGTPVRDPLPALPEQPVKMLFGTPGYMSPEQARGEPVDGRSDVFSVGALLYKIVMGHSPFFAHSANAAVKKAQQCRYPPLDTTAHGGMLPRSLFTVIRKAMANWIEDRYQTMEELAADLSMLLRGGGSFPARMLDRDTMVIQQGEDGDAAYIVLDGELEVFKTVNGKRETLRILRKGDVFGETAIFASVPRTASVITKSRVALARITADVIQHELDTMKPWMAALVRVLAQRFYEREGGHTEETTEEDPSVESKHPWWKPW